MGRSRPTVRNMIEKRREAMKDYKRMLRKQHQGDFETLWELATYDAPSIKASDKGDVHWLMLFAICRGQQREIEELREQLADQQ